VLRNGDDGCRGWVRAVSSGGPSYVSQRKARYGSCPPPCLVSSHSHRPHRLHTRLAGPPTLGYRHSCPQRSSRYAWPRWAASVRAWALRVLERCLVTVRPYPLAQRLKLCPDRIGPALQSGKARLVDERCKPLHLGVDLGEVGVQGGKGLAAVSSAQNPRLPSNSHLKCRTT
jgi:hypothetical protein